MDPLSNQSAPLIPGQSLKKDLSSFPWGRTALATTAIAFSILAVIARFNPNVFSHIGTLSPRAIEYFSIAGAATSTVGFGVASYIAAKNKAPSQPPQSNKIPEAFPAKTQVIEELPPQTPPQSSEISETAPENQVVEKHLSLDEKSDTFPTETQIEPLANKWANATEFQVMMKEKNKSLQQCLVSARQKVKNIKQMYQSLKGEIPTKMEAEVRNLLQTGSIKSVAGGKGGVYFLSDQEGNPKFVIKPGDEALLAINNGKHLASPFLDEDDVCSPVGGVHIYEAVQNAELAYETAKLFNLQEITPETEVMIIEDSIFHDILDETLEKNTPQMQEVELSAPMTKEKVCVVQRFADGYWDIGNLLSAKSKLPPETLKKLMEEAPEEYKQLVNELTPNDIDQLQYEKIAILSFLVGECDGNAGNLMCSKKDVEEGQYRSIMKIDNAASFPEHNQNLTTGLDWAVFNYAETLTGETKKFIQNLSSEKVDSIAALMKKRGKTEASINAFRKRVEYLQINNLSSETVSDLDFLIMMEEKVEEEEDQ